MLKIIFTVIFTYFFAKIMYVFFSDDYSGFSKKQEIIYIVHQKDGAVACATENIYKNIQALYQKNDLTKIAEEIDNKNCILLDENEELKGTEGICDGVDKNSVKLFESKKVSLRKIYVPCFAVKVKEISNK
jgi:hypothetical protein